MLQIDKRVLKKKNYDFSSYKLKILKNAEVLKRHTIVCLNLSEIGMYVCMCVCVCVCVCV